MKLVNLSLALLAQVSLAGAAGLRADSAAVRAILEAEAGPERRRRRLAATCCTLDFGECNPGWCSETPAQCSQCDGFWMKPKKNCTPRWKFCSKDKDCCGDKMECRELPGTNGDTYMGCDLPEGYVHEHFFDEDNEANNIGGDTGDASMTGEPHLTLFSGEKFDWHGICDLVMVDAPNFAGGQHLKIHVRTSEMKGIYSYISTGIVQIGYDKLELNEEGEYYWNGQLNAELPETWPGIDGSSLYQAENPWDKDTGKLFKFENGEGGVLTLELWHGIVSIFVNGFRADDLKGAVGLMGDHDTHRKLGRQGQEIENVDEYGREWQVKPAVDGKLFRDAGAAHCTIAGTDVSRRRLMESSTIPAGVAKAACSGSTVVQRGLVKECMFDVQAMQAIDWALSFYYHLKDHIDQDAVNEVAAAQACYGLKTAEGHHDETKFQVCHEAVMNAQSRDAAACFHDGSC